MNDYATNQFRRIYKPYLVEGARFGNEFDIPECPCTAKTAPKNLVHYADIDDHSTYEGFVHFYTYEYKFEDVWTNPHKALEKFKRCGGVITPDFATYQDMPAALKIYNTYRMRAIGYWLGKNGIEVINNVRWGTPETFKYCFLGIPQNSIVCVSTVGCNVKNEHDKRRFGAGLEIMVETLKPRHILMYGNAGRDIFTPYIERGIPVTFYDRPERNAAMPEKNVSMPITLTVAEFEEHYYLHDSSIDKIEYDAENKKLTLTIDFCFWMQRWYDKNHAKNGLIAVTFNNISHYSYEDYDPSKLFSDYTPEIWHTEIAEDGMLIMYTFEFVRYEPGEDLYPIMRIKADNVTVIDLNKPT